MLYCSSMYPLQAAEFFGSRKALAEVCGVSQTAVYHWFKQGSIPFDKQCLIQIEADRAGRKHRLIARKDHARPKAA